MKKVLSCKLHRMTERRDFFHNNAMSVMRNCNVIQSFVMHLLRINSSLP